MLYTWYMNSSYRIAIVPLFLALFLVAGCTPSALKIEEEPAEDAMEATEQTPPSPVRAPVSDTSCAAQSCGEEGTQVTCLRENGCFCSDQGCTECKKKNDTCNVSADCCGGQGLECQSVRLSNGSTEKRCLVLVDNVCNISCSANGTWEAPRGCTNDVVYEDIEDCDTFKGQCTPPIPGERPRKCLKS